MFQTNRWFVCSRTGITNMYNVIVPPAVYDVRLCFANTYAGTAANGSRVFDVFVNNQRVLASFDIIAAAGQTLTGYCYVSWRSPCVARMDCPCRLPWVSTARMARWPLASEP